MIKSLSIVAWLIGGVLVAVAIVYFMTPANSLPSFLPGHDPSLTKIHLKHGVVLLMVGAGLCAYAWFSNRRTSRRLIE